MKKIIGLLSFAALVTACGQSGYQITGSTEDVEEGTVVYLEKLNLDNNQFFAIDSTVVKDNSFVFKGATTNAIDQAFIHIGENPGRIPFILEDNNKIKVEHSKEKNLVSGTKYNDEYYSFIAKKDELTKPIVDFRAQNEEAYIKAKQENNTAVIEEIKNQDRKLTGAYADWYENYIETNRSSIATLITYNEYTHNGYYSKDEIEPIFDSFSLDLKTTTIGKALNEYISKLPEPAVKIGSKAPNFKALTPDEKN
ncbi:DUF4369 domain-containing protein [Myroides albus]|uniref:DUF4369 domain-containing protein n=1 Tax=Myroides albus TaxID=2562892 RepID=UPI00215908EF|nr:DUF4369 domain-containing protein [Myroides albus]UVD79711.1 DUF4369 domain-containing protein [Myroides albus]